MIWTILHFAVINLRKMSYHCFRGVVMLDKKYRDYFDIDPEYFSQVNEDIINNQPDYWKKFSYFAY